MGVRTSDISAAAAGATPGQHAGSHGDGGNDEASVAGLSGVLADAQVANKIKTSGDPVILSSTAPTAGQAIVATSSTAATWQTVASSADYAVSEFWHPPAVAHAEDVEGVLSSLGNYTLHRVSDWAAITPVVATEVSSLSSPSANTVRVSYNLKRSHISIQPALGYTIAVKRTFNASARPVACQFSTRIKVPVPTAPVVGDIGINFMLCADSAGNPNLTSDYVSCSVNVQSAGVVAIRSVCRSGNTNFGLVDSLNLIHHPFDCEMIIACSATVMMIFMRSGGSVHQLCQLTMAQMAHTNKQHLIVLMNSANTATAVMPFAPIYHIDYLRQLDTAEVF